MLAEYAVRESRGRRYPEPRHPYRNDFQRDRDRVTHSRAFRRLENKTQVFTERYSDHFRNRLTHTLEVSQISRTVAAELDLNLELVEALALAHDIGHPPFGHAGEKTLDELMREHGLCFEHNLHALRTVEQVEQRYLDFSGLNLTFEVREGIIKHSRDYDPAGFPELSEYLLELRPPLEAQLIDLSDEIAYHAADLDDGYEARILELEQIRSGLPIFDEFYRTADAEHPDSPDKLKFNQALRRMLDWMVTDVIENTRRRLAEFRIRALEDLRRCSERVAGFSRQVEEQRRQAKTFLYANLYFSPALAPEKHNAERVIAELFHYWMEHPQALPAGYQQKAREESLPRVICDYIAGMTDNFILRQHARFARERSRAGIAKGQD